MSFFSGLAVDVFGFSIVFVVLIILALIVKSISAIIHGEPKKDRKETIPQEVPGAIQSGGQVLQKADGKLKLYNVNEKTAALIMAIVSDESKIPLSQLRFDSIKLIK